MSSCVIVQYTSSVPSHYASLRILLWQIFCMVVFILLSVILSLNSLFLLSASPQFF